MQLVVVGLIFIWATLQTQAKDPSLDAEWNAWKASHGKSYNSTEAENARREIWEERRAHILAHNALHDKGLQKYTLEHNRFSDWTLEEFKVLGGSTPSPEELAKHLYQIAYGVSSGNITTKTVRQGLPDTFSWRDKGAVTPVRDQGDCNSCWAFATTGAIEGAHFIRSGQLVTLSEENFIDCVDDGDPRPDRCSEGCFCESAMKWAMKTSGITTDAAYPLVSTQANVPTAQAPCKSIGDNQLKVKVTDAVKLTSGSEDDLKEAVATIGPITVLVYQDLINNMHYSTGTFDDPSCKNGINDLNHAVLAVGYGTDSDGVDYWMIKNSYGPEWGDEGYMFIKRGVNQCGVAQWNWYPTVGN